MKIQLIRNATLKLKYAGQTFLIDPYFAERNTQPSFAGKSKNPTTDLPLSLEEIMAGVDYVVISHLHPDHFDEAAHNRLPKNIRILCQPEDYDSITAKGFTCVGPVYHELKSGEVIITRTTGRHGSGPILEFMGSVSGFVFQSPIEESLYWLGDTIFYDDVKDNIRNYRPNVIVCHAGGNRFFKEFNVFGPQFIGDTDSLIMDKYQVVELANFASESKIIATHIGALDHETVTRQQLREYASCNGISSERLLILNDGETNSFHRNKTFTYGDLGLTFRIEACDAGGFTARRELFLCKRKRKNSLRGYSVSDF